MEQQVYNECTCCNKNLTKEEIEKNKKNENYYYTICDDCLEKAYDRIVKIVYNL